MPKVNMELVKLAMQRNELDIRTVAKIMEDINGLVSLEDETEKTPAVKKQFAVMVSDPNEELKGKDLLAWVLQLPEEDSPHVAEERLHRAAYEFNQTPKGRRLPVKSIGEVCEFVSPRITKEQSVWVKTKEPVLLITTNNKLPLIPDANKVD